MAVELITKEDLNAFKFELLSEIKTVLKAKNTNSEQKEWLKSYEVRKMLRISPGTLQHLRVSGTITYTKIGGLMFYKHSEILRLLDENSSSKQSRAI